MTPPKTDAKRHPELVSGSLSMSLSKSLSRSLSRSVFDFFHNEMLKQVQHDEP
ncbi:MAG: hypothetical protein LBO62_05760 [Endomicrobium sp.]|nr:hypothetical protein [Endomicrobium sp.]